jgi:putative DNA-invertase from lambdoid prophage Rac
LARALQDAQRGRFQVLLVWALDRLFRDGALAIPLLVQRFHLARVKVVGLQERWTEAPGELEEVLLAITGCVARMESQRRSERTRAGLVRALAQGKKLGRPPA